MDVKSAVAGRRNVRKFKPAPIDTKQIESWLESASYAPNHRMSEPWEVRLIGPETRSKLNHKTNFGDAPVVLAFLSKAAESELDRDENLIASSCFVQNFQLLAFADGVCVRWTSIGATAASRGLLGVPDGYVVVGILGVGYPEEIPQPKPRTPMNEKIQYLN